MPTRPKKSRFLALPRELRQQILAETLNLEIWCPEPIWSSAKRKAIARVIAKWKETKYAHWVDRLYGRTALRGIESCIEILKEAFSNIAEDVEYVAGKDELLQLLRQLTTEAPLT